MDTNKSELNSIEIAQKVRKACITSAREGFQDASMSGLCTEGAIEAAISSIQSLDLEKIIAKAENPTEMKQSIIGYHKDAQDDWVAELGCGHTQHVRHNPPWQLRPWVTSEEGREKHIGHLLECKKCDRREPKDFNVPCQE